MTTLTRQVCIALLYLSLFTSEHMFAQVVPDTLELDEIVIQATRYELEPADQPVKVIRFDAEEIAVYSGDNISRLLEERSAAFVRNNGPGGLSTVAMRGMNPNQTQVLWNGFHINDPMNGLVDFSLIPASFIQSVEVSPGNSSTAFGSGAAGGTVHLDTRFRTRSGSIWQHLGAFGQNIQGAGGGWHQDNWHGSLMLQREDSDYDFPYRVEFPEGATETGRRTNNSVHAMHALANAGYEGERISFLSTLWWYDMENHIPGSLQFPSEEAVQTDNALRWLNRLSWSRGRHQLDLRLLYSNTDQTYVDPAFGIDTENRTRTRAAEFSWRLDLLENLSLTQTASLSSTEGESDSYESRQSQTIFGMQTNPVWEPSQRVRLFSGLRYDYYEIAGDAFSASLGFNVKLIGEQLRLRGQISRNFVAPTYNDLFWVPSGNPDLLPETNRKGEIGLLHAVDNGRLNLQSDITFFAGRHDDGIRWIFNPDAGSFQARNIDEIYSRGFELGSRLSWKLSPSWKVNTGMHLSYTRSTIEDFGGENSPEVGKQLVYMPQWSYQFDVSASYRNATVGLNYSWNGERFSTQDHSAEIDPLDPYRLSNAYLQLQVPYQKVSVDFIGKIRNILDEDYQVISGYPLPGRHLQFTMRFNIYDN